MTIVLPPGNDKKINIHTTYICKYTYHAVCNNHITFTIPTVSTELTARTRNKDIIVEAKLFGNLFENFFPCLNYIGGYGFGHNPVGIWVASRGVI